MFITGPMTLIVLVVLATMLALGLWIIVRAMRKRTGPRPRIICPKCKKKNRGHAEFCARCGRALT